MEKKNRMDVEMNLMLVPCSVEQLSFFGKAAFRKNILLMYEFHTQEQRH